MQLKHYLVAALFGLAVAQNNNDNDNDNDNGGDDSDMSLCDKYTTALFMNNNGTNQQTLLTLVVNTAVIGTYVKDPKPMNQVDGILNNGTMNGNPVSLLKYFDGSLKSTNRNGKAVSMNFLDGGAADALMNNMPGKKGSNQYFLLTHLYEYFGALLGCAAKGQDAFPSYSGVLSQYSVHKYMDLDEDEFMYFVKQVGDAATSFGVTDSDAMSVGESLVNTFGSRCAAPAKVITGEQPQSICQDTSCPKADDSLDQCPAQYTPMMATAMNGGSDDNGDNDGAASTLSFSAALLALSGVVGFFL